MGTFIYINTVIFQYIEETSPFYNSFILLLEQYFHNIYTEQQLLYRILDMMKKKDTLIRNQRPHIVVVLSDSLNYIIKFFYDRVQNKWDLYIDYNVNYYIKKLNTIM